MGHLPTHKALKTTNFPHSPASPRPAQKVIEKTTSANFFLSLSASARLLHRPKLHHLGAVLLPRQRSVSPTFERIRRARLG